jgi:zinc transport system permease protein
MDILALISMPFFSRALIALVASGAAFPVLGTFILNLELIPARFAVMHAALLGAAVALLFNIDPSWTAMAASILSGLGIALASWRGKVSAGGSLGLLMTVCMGLSFIIFYKSNVQAIQAFDLFWGNILALSVADTALAVGIAALIFIFLFAAWKEIHIVLYSRELSEVSGVHTKLIYGLIMLSVCAGIAASMRITGALLVDAVTLLPALAARQIGRSFRSLIVLGAVFGLATNMTGFTLAFALDLPVSPAIIVCGAAIVGILRLCLTIRNKKSILLKELPNQGEK